MSIDPEIDKYMDEVAERNRAGLRLARAGSVPVGSFWFMQEPGEPPTIVSDRVFVPEGNTDGPYITCHNDYVTCWKTLTAHRADDHTRDYLDCFGPADWPRGRVVFNTAVKRFEVSLDKQLATARFENEILARFHLTRDETSFAIDPGYTATRFTLDPDGPGTLAL